MECKLTAQEFIGDGKIFICKLKSNETIVSVSSYVTKKADIYSLHVTGDYEHGGSVVIEIGDKNMSIDDTYTVAQTCLLEFIPLLITEDYPLSLKKIARLKKLETITI
jgi:hypothetical protein